MCMGKYAGTYSGSCLLSPQDFWKSTRNSVIDKTGNRSQERQRQKHAHDGKGGGKKITLTNFLLTAPASNGNPACWGAYGRLLN